MFNPKYLLAGLVVSTMTLAEPPGPHFRGKVSEIFVNNVQQVLIAVSGYVSGTCAGTYGPYNLTFNLTDPAGIQKLDLVQEALRSGRNIAGNVSGCGSSNINKVLQLSIY